MKSRLVILALVGLTAGVVGTVGSRIVGGSDLPPAEAKTVTQAAVPVAKAKSNDKQCRALVRKVSKTPMSDAQLKKLLKKNRQCRAVVIDSKAPAMASTSSPNFVTLPATAPAPSTVSDDTFADDNGDDSYNDDEGSENEQEDNNMNNNFENGEDD